MPRATKSLKIHPDTYLELQRIKLDLSKPEDLKTFDGVIRHLTQLYWQDKERGSQN